MPHQLYTILTAIDPFRAQTGVNADQSVNTKEGGPSNTGHKQSATRGATEHHGSHITR
jgi:hypothetical protein